MSIESDHSPKPHEYSAQVLFHLFFDLGENIQVGGLEIEPYSMSWEEVLNLYLLRDNSSGDQSLEKLEIELDEMGADLEKFYYFRITSNKSEGNQLFYTDKATNSLLQTLSHKYGGTSIWEHVMPRQLYDKIWEIGCEYIDRRNGK